MKSENKNNNLHSTDPKHSALDTFTTVIFYLAILFFIIGFNFSHNPAGNWYQQFMPFLNNRPLTDITFTDSLNGFAVTGDGTVGDTNYIVKTSDAGNSWNIIFTVYRDLRRVTFLNQDTGFVCGGFNYSPGNYLIKTTNGGTNWTIINTPNGTHIIDMFVLNNDSIWFSCGDFGPYNLYRTTNGGINWEFLTNSSSNLNKIYMYNGRIGFFSTVSRTFKTTNGGFNWIQIPGEGAFFDMYFADSLTGWKANDTMKKTTDGGISWQAQPVPRGPGISFGIYSFSNINRDTIWGAGGTTQYPNLQNRGLVYRTTNGGNNWLFQVPDTSYGITAYGNIQFINKNSGWAYGGYKGIHTTNGGDTNFYIGIQQISNNIPKDFELKQNYPNPFNPRTVIPYKLKNAAFVRLIAYEVTGKETQIMVNQHQQAGEYEVDFMGKFATSSGVYFYRMEITDSRSKQVYTETKKMVLIR